MQKDFSYPIKIDELKQSEYKYVINADADELTDITEILQVEQAKSFAAEIFLKFEQRQNLLTVWGNVCAKLVHKSVISVENFERDYRVPFQLVFDTKATYRDIREMEHGIDTEVPDIIENGEINLADILLEQIALQIEDYPRAEGEVFDYEKYADNTFTEKENPFAVLAKLKK
jgi:uncharacterized metal-binding protein YceD (DUF177 family)